MNDDLLQSTGIENTSLASTKAEGTDSNLRGILLFTITFLALLGLVGITIFVILGTGDMVDDEVVDNKRARDGAAGRRRPQVLSPRSVRRHPGRPPRRPPSRPKTPRRSRPVTPPVKPPVTPPQTVPPTEPPKFSVTELVCTVGTFAVIPAVIPPDGLCTYIFYCDVVPVGGALYGIETNSSLKVFEEQIQKHAATQGGLSFDVRYVFPENFDNAKLREELETLSQQNVKHYGFLNMVTDATHVAADVERARLVIDRFKELQGNDATRKTMIAMGLSDYSEPDAWNLYSTQFRIAIEKTKADTVFALSSMGSQQSGDNCIAVPPAVFDAARLPDVADAQSAAFPSLKRQATLVSADVQYGRSNIKLGLSFEMGTMVYQFETVQEHPDKSVYAKCTVGYVTNADVVDCETEGLTEQIPAGLFIGVLKDDLKVVFMWDNEVTFSTKLDDLRKLSKLRSGMSLLLHNSHLGDFSGTCMKDPFERIQSIKKHLGIP
ncbi:hypothetical protein MTO96_015609 [Rhipicephalus appendiculatus]